LIPMDPPGQIPVTPRAPRTGRFQASSAGGVLSAMIFDEHHYARLNGQVIINCPAGVSVMALAGPSNLRNLLQFRNASATENIYVSFGAEASTTALLMLEPNDQVLYDVVVPQDDIYAYASSAAVLIIGYSTIPGQQV